MLALGIAQRMQAVAAKTKQSLPPSIGGPAMNEEGGSETSAPQALKLSGSTQGLAGRLLDILKLAAVLLIVIPITMNLVGRMKEGKSAILNSPIFMGLVRTRLNNNSAVGRYEAEYYREVFACIDSMLYDGAGLQLTDKLLFLRRDGSVADVKLAPGGPVDLSSYVDVSSAQWQAKKQAYAQLAAAVNRYMEVFRGAEGGRVETLALQRMDADGLRSATLRLLLTKADAMDGEGVPMDTVNPASLMRLCARVEADLYVFARGMISFSNTRTLCPHYQTFLLGYLLAFGYLKRHGAEGIVDLVKDKRRWLSLYMQLEDMFENPRWNSRRAPHFVDTGRTFTDEEASMFLKIIAEFDLGADTGGMNTTSDQGLIKEYLNAINDKFFRPLIKMLHSQFSWHPVPRDRLSAARGLRMAGSAFEQQTNRGTDWSYGIMVKN